MEVVGRDTLSPLTVVPAEGRYPGDGRGYSHNPHPPPTPPYPLHRRAGVGRYPGDGRGYPHKHPKYQTAHTHSTVVPGSDLTPPSTTHQHPLTPYRRTGVGRYPWDGRGYPDKHPKNQTAHTHSTVVPGSDLTPPSTTHQQPLPLTVVPAKAGTHGQGAATTTTVIPHQHPLTPYRRAGVGRYPGDGRGYPDKHPKNQTAHTHSTVVPGSDLTPPRTTHQHPPTIPPSFWPPSVFPDPAPEPRGARQLPNCRPCATLPGPICHSERSRGI